MSLNYQWSYRSGYGPENIIPLARQVSPTPCIISTAIGGSPLPCISILKTGPEESAPYLLLRA
jgi:hypothetical protein